MSEVTVCLNVSGHRNFFSALRQCVLSILQHTGFGIFVGHPPGASLNLPSDPRITSLAIPTPPGEPNRAKPFLYTFSVLEQMLQKTRSRWIIQMDVDAIMVKSLSDREVEGSLQGQGFGLVEQTTISGSDMTRADFLEHYKNHSLVWLNPDAVPPAPEDFRYYNSGVVLGERSEFEKFIPWALETIQRTGWKHEVGPHLIGDQDYFQYWTNNLHPGCCTELDWRWNHCQHWDRGFPRPEAYVLHFSNFCIGPGRVNLLRMRYHRLKSKFLQSPRAN